MRLNFSFAARYSLKFTRCSLLVARCKIRSLLVAKVAGCRNSVVTCCKICSLLVAEVAHCKKITRFSLQNSLVTRCRSWSPQILTRYSLQNLLVTHCWSCSLQKSHSLLSAKFACYLLRKITHYSLQKFLVAKNHLPLVKTITS